MQVNKVILCIGSNSATAREKVDAALEWLGELLPDNVHTAPYQTEPYGEGASAAPYHNAVFTASTALTEEELVARFKAYEQANGRVHGSSFPAEIAIDIDLVVWNGTVRRPGDYSAPYFLKGIGQLPHL